MAYAGFSKGGARKFENKKNQKKNFFTQNHSFFFCPKLGEDQQKKGVCSDLVWFLAQN